MEFLSILQDLKNKYSKNCIMRENDTLLLKPDKVPNCRHMLFQPLADKYIQSYLVSEYKNNFPKEYMEVLKYSNGANLYRVKLNMDGVSFAHSMFVIFGLPLTSPFGRPLDREEPFDLRIEDLARHNELSDKWLKCGTYTKNFNFNVQNDIFIDTESGHVYACEKNQNTIVDSWTNLDECFCNIFETFSDSMYEYDN